MIKKYVIFVFILVIVLSCMNHQNVEQKNINQVDSTLLLQKSTFIGKKLKSLQVILTDTIDLSNKVILVYNGFDCQDCINAGYRIVNRIDSLFGNQRCYVVATSSNIGRNKLENNYQKFVYYDEHDLIRSELKYVYTPVLLMLDSLSLIKDGYFPGNHGNSVNEKTFIIKCTDNAR